MRGALFALVLLSSTVPALAAPGLDDYRRLNEDIVVHHVLPRYDRLVAATAALREATGRGCEQPGTALASLRDGWRAAAAAWQGVQHIRFGPIELFMRGMRFAFWPDSRNSVGRGLDEVIAGRAPASISGETFARGGVPVQGLPALERLLFGAESAPKLLAGDPEAAFRCAMVQAIGSNLSDLATGIRRDWTEGADPFAKAMSGGAGPYADAKEATAELFKSLHAAVEIVADHKLARPLGASAQAARPQLAESFHSRTSMDNIRANLEAAESLYLGAGGRGFSGFVRDVVGDKALDDLLKRAFTQTRATAASVALPLEEAVSDPAERRKLMQLARETGALKTLLAQRLTSALDIPVGFNALDGD